MSRVILSLSKKERDMLARAAEFALAGEWPWQDCLSLRQQSIDAAALQRAADKLASRRSERKP